MRVKKKYKKCATSRCIRPARKGSSICTTCDKRIWREKYPMKAAFQTLRHNSIRRGKIFELTFEQFKKFCYETDYMAGKGRKKKSFTIDRIDNSKGYVVDNIQMLSKSENSKKHTKVLMYDWETKTAKVI